jgi:ribosomal-protein-alanine N-acetyltransferase
VQNISMLADIAVRLATSADAAEIAAMSRDEIEHGLPWRWRPGRVARAIADVETNVVVVGEPGTLVAFGIMSYRDEEAHLLLFAVRPASRRRGVGSAVLRWLEDVALAAGTRRIHLEARRENAAARLFYNEHGYHERAIRPGMYADSVDGIQLEKWLGGAWPPSGGSGLQT